ncbi:MAG: hypothetical protein IJ308_08000 [Clostridia bacterium]|nr:hypothetical protein [Clostridia bacterium]
MATGLSPFWYTWSLETTNYRWFTRRAQLDEETKKNEGKSKPDASAEPIYNRVYLLVYLVA